MGMISLGFGLIPCSFDRVRVVDSLLGSMISLAIGSWPDSGFFL